MMMDDDRHDLQAVAAPHSSRGSSSSCRSALTANAVKEAILKGDVASCISILDSLNSVTHAALTTIVTGTVNAVASCPHATRSPWVVACTRRLMERHVHASPIETHCLLRGAMCGAIATTRFAGNSACIGHRVTQPTTKVDYVDMPSHIRAMRTQRALGGGHGDGGDDGDVGMIALFRAMRIAIQHCRNARDEASSVMWRDCAASRAWDIMFDQTHTSRTNAAGSSVGGDTWSMRSRLRHVMHAIVESAQVGGTIRPTSDDIQAWADLEAIAGYRVSEATLRTRFQCILTAVEAAAVGGHPDRNNPPHGMQVIEREVLAHHPERASSESHHPPDHGDAASTDLVQPHGDGNHHHHDDDDATEALFTMPPRCGLRGQKPHPASRSTTPTSTQPRDLIKVICTSTTPRTMRNTNAACTRRGSRRGGATSQRTTGRHTRGVHIIKDIGSGLTDD